ncbi:MAG: acetyl-CoA synthetase [Candidatus Thorarchaeota archaeon]|nr:MAG: acetyl-CoA synthetase [Candidatus Thorarchaeota archaeon]
MDPFFSPHAVALVGASADPKKLGNSIMANLVKSSVRVYPISRTPGRVMGVETYSSLTQLPETVDLVIVAVDAKNCPGLIPDIRRSGARCAVVVSGGFSETGSEGTRLEESLVRAARDSKVRLIGPNCVGVLNTRLFNGTFTIMPERGNIAFVSQSGALGGASIYTTQARRIGLSKFASIGNAADIEIGEVLDYFREDADSTVIAVYIEGIKEGRKLYESLRNASREKPVVVLKGGRSESGNTAVKSHTGSLAVSTAVFTGMLRQAGCVTAPTLDTLFELCKIFDYQPLPKGRNVCIITNTGGAGVLAADAVSDLGLTMSTLSQKTRHEISSAFSPLASVDNPIDLLATGARWEYRVATEQILRDSSVDMLLEICVVPTFAGMTQVEHAEGLLEGVRAAGVQKPVVGVWLAGSVGKPGKDLLESNRIPCYDDPSLAALCLARAADYAQFRRPSVRDTS